VLGPSSPFMLSVSSSPTPIYAPPNARALPDARQQPGLVPTRGRGGEPDTVAGVTRLGVPLRARGGDWNAANLRTIRSYGHEIQRV
jgi:hypothetical protein